MTFCFVKHSCSFSLLITILTCLQISSIEENHSQPFDKNSKQVNLIPNDIKICDGNRFEFISSYVLGKQDDLTKTFTEIQTHIQVQNISYSDKIGRLYKIYNFKPHLVYLQSKQIAQIKSLNVVNISGGSVRLNYTFEWLKQQIGSQIKGNGSGLVSSDMISFQKILETNQNRQMEWVFKSALPIKISNSLTLSKFTPYKEADYEIINQMLNQLKDNLTTVKTELIKSLNTNFTTILKAIIKQDQTILIPKQIQYSYLDYRGQFAVTFDNSLLENGLSKTGLSLLLSQVIKDDKNFECGQKVPDQPQDLAKYGGTQQFISNKFFKSTLKFALVQHFLDVTLTQQDWQSRAFQFCAGDLHQTIVSTKNMSSFTQLQGKCQALDDKTFSFDKKTISSYGVTANFSCSIFQNATKIVDIIMPVEYQITPQVNSRQLNFTIKSIKTTPKFIQSAKFKITNPDLASFMLTQTLNTAIKSLVIGSGFKTRNRKNAQLEVRDGYLFLYDKSSIGIIKQEL